VTAGALAVDAGTRPWSRRRVLASTWFPSVVAVVIAAGATALLLSFEGVGFGEGVRVLWEFAGSDAFSRRQWIQRSIPLALIAIGLIFPFRAGIWNVGAEGQFLLGAAGAAAVATKVSLPGPSSLAGMAVVGTAAGGVWAWIAGRLRADHGINEVVVTLMLNLVAYQLFVWALRVPLRDPGSPVPQTASFDDDSVLPKLPWVDVHAGLLVLAVLAVVAAVVLARSRLGLQLRAVGHNAAAAEALALPVGRLAVRSMVISGSVAGLAGMLEASGVHERALLGMSPGFGFTAVVVMLLGQRTVVGCLLGAALFGFLVVGADGLQTEFGVAPDLVTAVQAIAVLAVLGVSTLVARGGGA
jgi:general nucleoside transport system permease protein